MYEWNRAVRFVEDRTFFGVTLLDWVTFVGLTLVLFLILRVVVAALRRRLRGNAGKTEHRYDDYALQVLDHTWNASLLAFAAFFSLYFVHLEPAAAAAPTPDAAVAATKAASGPRPLDNVEHTIRVLALLVIFLQAGRWGMGLIDEGLKQGFRFANFSESASQTAYNVVRFFALAGLWTVVVILILGSFGIEVAPLLATLGVGGIAVGFALQKILADLFCSVAIVLDRPFEAGDFIITGDDMGAVEKIGVKTTRVRSLGGEQIVFPNSDLIGSRIHNYKRMAERRVTFGFGVLYSTPADTLEAIGPAVKEIIEDIEKTRFDRAHFASFGDSSLNYEVVYYVLSPDYNLFMDIQQEINLRLVRRLAELGTDFAFPSRTVYLEGTPAPLRTEVVMTDAGKSKASGG